MRALSSLCLRGAAFLTLTTLLAATTASARADDLQGAQALVQKLSAAQASSSTSNSASSSPAVTITPPPNPGAGQMLVPVADYVKQAGQLSPAQAGTKWADLVLRLEKDNQSSLGGGMGGEMLQSQGVMDVIPAPAAWPAIQSQMELKLPDAGLPPVAALHMKLLAHTLNNSEQAQWADIRALADLPPPAPPPGLPAQLNQEFIDLSGPRTQALHFGEKLSIMAGDADAVEAFWREMLRRMKEAQPTPQQLTRYPMHLRMSQMPMGFGFDVELPDLVAILGADRAEPLITQALLLPNTPIQSISGHDTQRLARQLALKHVDELKQAPWALTESLDGAELYEALTKKFPNDPQRGQVTIYYVLALVAQGRADDALKAAADVDTSDLQDAVEQASEHGWAEQVYAFLHRYLSADPSRAAWSDYVLLAAQTGHAAEALQFVQDTLARKDLTDGARAQVLSVLYSALLANDKVDDGIAQLRALIALRKSQPPPQTNSWSIEANSLLDLDMKLARLGHVLQRPDLENEGVAGGLDLLNSVSADNSNPNSGMVQSYQRRQFIIFLIETGHAAKAEKLLFDGIATLAQPIPVNKPNRNNFFSNRSCQEDLVTLALIYYQAGRWDDILTLVRKVPLWDASDLVTIAGERSGIYRYSTPSLGLMVARALAETGDVATARTVLDYVLQVDSGDDAAYELLLKIGQGDLVAKLDALYALDQFQNRPLIWKAVILLSQGKTADAEAACKAAIAVDPSDGETGKGDRMRVYAVMAQVKAAENDPDQAKFFGNVIKAIRLSENADDFFDAGLLTRAVTMYGQALDLFSDAYCIQSRIARQLAELGRMDEAAVHYRKAFELMPVSFGRMESHCFGCERAFQGKTAEDIAGQTFTDMLRKDPNKPQLHYLLGYLRMEEQRYSEALPEFVKAGQLDPDYINAWKQITVIGDNYQLPPNLRDEAVFNLIRLDPAGRHVRPDVQYVRDLAKLWTVTEQAQKALPPAPASLLPIAARPKDTSGNAFETYVSGRNSSSRSPRQAITQNTLIQALVMGMP